MASRRGSSGGDVTDKNERTKPLTDTPLIPEPEFADALRALLRTTKAESDRLLEDFRASNEAKRKRPRPDS
jgi:hypothetical protein